MKLILICLIFDYYVLLFYLLYNHGLSHNIRIGYIHKIVALYREFLILLLSSTLFCVHSHFFVSVERARTFSLLETQLYLCKSALSRPAGAYAVLLSVSNYNLSATQNNRSPFLLQYQTFFQIK